MSIWLSLLDDVVLSAELAISSYHFWRRTGQVKSGPVIRHFHGMLGISVL
jgi:hypothetical protein